MVVFVISFMVLLLIGLYSIDRKISEIRHYLMLRDGHNPTTWAVAIHQAVAKWKKEYKDSLPR